MMTIVHFMGIHPVRRVTEKGGVSIPPNHDIHRILAMCLIHKGQRKCGLIV